MREEKEMSATHTISNASTFHGWLESVGLDDFLENPCGCIFGDEDDELAQQVPLPGQRSRAASQRNNRASQRSNAGGAGGSGGARARRAAAMGSRQGTVVSRQATIEVVDETPPRSPFAAISFFGGAGGVR